MGFENDHGRNIIAGIAAYSVGKCVLNMFLSSFSLSSLLLALGFAVLLFVPVKLVNYIAAGILGYIAISHLPDNLSNISSNWIYLVEGIIDIACAVTLVINRDVKSNYYRTININ